MRHNANALRAPPIKMLFGFREREREREREGETERGKKEDLRLLDIKKEFKGIAFHNILSPEHYMPGDKNKSKVYLAYLISCHSTLQPG